MRILFAIGIAVSALLLASCTNPDTSGGVTMQKEVGDGHPSNWPFPHGSCSDQHSFAETNTGCGWISVNASYSAYYIMPTANLAQANLSGVNLKVMDTCMVGANLYSANLSGADLYSAVLEQATLYGSDLTNADLTGARLNGANLTGANLTGAMLRGVRTMDLIHASSSTICPNGINWGTAGNNCGFYSIQN